MANPYVVDFSPVTNALASIQKQRNSERDFAENQRQFEAQNYLAQAQFGLRKEAAGRQAAEYERQKAVRGEVQNWLASHPGAAGVPQPIIDLARIQGDASGVQSYILADAKRRAAQNGPEEFGKTGAVFQGPDGRYYTIQFGSRGQRSVQPVETGGQPLSPAKGVAVVGDEMYNTATGQTVRNVAPQIAGKERAKEIGQAGGKASADLQRVVDNANQTLKLIGDIKTNPGTERNYGIAGIFPNVPGSRASDAWAMIEQLGGKAFLEAFNSLKGGGQITEVEGQKATNAIVRMQKAQSYPALIRALNDFESVIRIGVERARKAAAGGASTTMTEQSPQRLRYNPETGELE